MSPFKLPGHRFPCFASLSLLLLLLGLGEAKADETLSPALLQEIEASCVPDAAFEKTRTALAQSEQDSEALDPQAAKAMDMHFSLRLRDEAISDQKESGRCWMFAGLNVFRRGAARKLGLEDLEFSQSYLFFFDKLEKANLFLEAIIRSRQDPIDEPRVSWLLHNVLQDSGNWLGFTELVKKYGLVPKTVMPETYASSHSEGLNEVLRQRLKLAALRLRAAADEPSRAALKTEALKDVYRILALNLGIPPKTFTWQAVPEARAAAMQRSYTPQQFATTVIEEDLDDYVALYSIPTLPWERHYEIDLCKAVEGRPNMHFVNCPLPLLKEMARACLETQTPVWFGCAVSQQMSPEAGLMTPGLYDYEKLYGVKLTMNRRELFETYTSTPEHNMVLIGVDLVEGRPVKWLVENSRGEDCGRKGLLVMSEAWFDRYVQVVVVSKKLIPEKYRRLFEEKPVTLPPWDPMS